FRILAGLDTPTTGEILFNGAPVQISSPNAASRLGIELVTEHPLLIEQLDLVENIFLGHELGWHTPLSAAPSSSMIEHARALIADLAMPPTLLREPTVHLTDEQRQVIAIARALCVTPRLLLLDDALSVLSFQRQDLMLKRIQDLAAHGTSVMITSDDL